MTANQSDSICRITSISPDSSQNSGTGFFIHQKRGLTYVLTCAHVVKGVSPEQVQINRKPVVKRVWLGEDPLDIAVLEVEGVEDKPLLKLWAMGEVGKQIVIPGISKFRTSGEEFVYRPLKGVLGEPIKLSKHDFSIDAWDLKIDGDYGLRSGYSGSPVIDIVTGYVLGVASFITRKEGDLGVAIAISTITKVWIDIPDGLITTHSFSSLKPMTSTFKDERIRQLHQDIEIEKKREQSLTEEIENIVQLLDDAPEPEQLKLDRRKERKKTERQKVRDEIEQLQKHLHDLENN